MWDGCSKGSKPNSISYSKKSANVQAAICIVSWFIQLKILSNHSTDIICLASWGEKLAWKYRECSSIVDVAPIESRCKHICDKCKTQKYVQNREERCPHWTSQEGANTWPVQGNGTYTKAIQTWAQLLGCHWIWPCPANPGERCQHVKQVARHHIVAIAACESYEKKLKAG